MRRTLKRIAGRSGTPKRIHPHIFRYSLATNLLLNGCDLVTIQNQLGHSDIRVTMLYVQFTPKILRRQYDAFCPDYLGEGRPSQSGEDSRLSRGADDRAIRRGSAASEVRWEAAAAAVSERQKRALVFLAAHGRITNRGYRASAGVSHETARADLDDLCRKGKIKREGGGRSVYYSAI